MTRRNRPIDLTDAPEHRSIPLDRVEIRMEDEVTLVGYASTFDEYEMYGGPASYGWIERIDPGAFDKTLREKPDLHLLINHAGMPLARTKSGTLALSVDERGLKVEARLDKRDPEVQALAVKMERGDMDEMSFAFRVKAQEWRAAPGFEDDNQSYRTITEISLHKGDVSVVNWGANSTTSAEILSASDLLRAFVDCDDAEIRSDDIDLIKRAMLKLAKVVDEPEGIEAKEEIEDSPAEASRMDELLRTITEEDLVILRELILGEKSDEAADEAVEETRDESVEEAGEATPPTKVGMSVAEALAFQGELSDGPIPLEIALAFS